MEKTALDSGRLRQHFIRVPDVCQAGANLIRRAMAQLSRRIAPAERALDQHLEGGVDPDYDVWQGYGRHKCIQVCRGQGG